MNTFQTVFIIFCFGIFIWIIASYINDAKEQRRQMIEELKRRGSYGRRKDDVQDPDEIIL